MMYFLEFLAIGLIVLGILFEEDLVEFEDIIIYCIKHPKKVTRNIINWIDF